MPQRETQSTANWIHTKMRISSEDRMNAKRILGMCMNLMISSIINAVPESKIAASMKSEAVHRT